MPSLAIDRKIVEGVVKNIREEVASLNGNNRLLKRQLSRLGNTLSKLLKSSNYSKPVRVPADICAELEDKDLVIITDIPQKNIRR